MLCPICGKSVTFPAIPPGRRKLSLPSQRLAAERDRKWAFDVKSIFPVLGRFEHWNLVLVCLVPFVIVGALLAGAAVVRSHFGSDPAQPVEPAVVHADRNAWQKSVDLARAEQAVQEQVGIVIQAKANAVAADRNVAKLQALYQGKSMDQLASYNYTQQMQANQQIAARAQRNLESARQCFENAFRTYQSLGGGVDYRRQLPQ
jgi:hypothetical protein